MKIVVTASGRDLDSSIDSRFGRCQHFIFVDPDSLRFKPIRNENVMVAWGAGIQSAQFIANKGAEAVITGNLGPNASATLTAAGVRVFLGAMGTVREAIERFKNGRLQEVIEPSVQAPLRDGRAAGSRAYCTWLWAWNGPRYGHAWPREGERHGTRNGHDRSYPNPSAYDDESGISNVGGSS
jgi:predicted Fe-Mo cluster-binding NifX family protein